MYFITKRNSETGKKFQVISEKRQLCRKAQISFSEKHGFDKFRPDRWGVFGGISSCCNFHTTPNSKIWGKGAAQGEFMPKGNSKEGKAILKEIKELPTVSRHELNQCIGFDGAPFNTIGFAENNDSFFGFIVGDKWEVKIPSDCKEVTFSDYKKHFPD